MLIWGERGVAVRAGWYVEAADDARDEDTGAKEERQ